MTLKGTGSIILDGKHISMPEGTMIRIAPRFIARSAMIRTGMSFICF